MSSTRLTKYKHLHPYRKIYIPLLLIFGITAMGVVGFMNIEHYTFLDSMYMTIITLSTVGYKEVQPLSNAGKVFDMFLIITNIVLVTFFISNITSYFLDGDFKQHIKLIKMERSISALRGHTIVCGYGRNGRAAASILRQNNAPFVVIERHLVDRSGLDYYIEGDATDEETLMDAGITHAGAVLVTLPVDSANLYIVLSARQLNSQVRIISRASETQAVKKMKIAGADNVIMPDKIGGTHMATLVLNPGVKEFIDILATHGFEGTTIDELVISKPIKLRELEHWRNTGANILGIRKQKQYTLNPGYDVEVQTGDYIIVMGSKEQIAALELLLGVA